MESRVKRRGKIRNIPHGKSFGFIVDDNDGKDYFFHSSAYKGDWTSLTPGRNVLFDLNTREGKIQACSVELGPSAPTSVSHSTPSPRRVLGPYAGSDLNLNDSERLRTLNEISRWKLEAKLDDIKRYFFAVPELNDILTGDASYVIGRKGTGKTALVQYLSNANEKDQCVSKLTFKNFPFNELYAQGNDNYRRPNQYITIWKLIIYSAACRLIAQSTKCDPMVRDKIQKAFPNPDSDNLGTIIGKWISGDFGISVLGSGLSISKWFKDKQKYSLQDKVENLEQFVLKNIPDQKILVLFDELDEDYKEIFENYNKSDYLDLLTSLFKAVQDVRSIFAPGDNKLYPVVFLRDDIYDLLQDPDKINGVTSKWILNGTPIASKVCCIIDLPKSLVAIARSSTYFGILFLADYLLNTRTEKRKLGHSNT
jgi:cold shock CspA family protein